MLALRWAGSALLLGYWLLANPVIYWDENQPSSKSWVFLVAGVLLFIWSEPKKSGKSAASGEKILGFALTLLSIFLEGPLQAPILILGLSFFLSTISVVSHFEALARRLRPVAWLLVVNALVLSIAPYVLGRIHSVPLFAYPIYGLGKAFGLDVSTIGDQIVVPQRAEAVAFDVSLEKLALLPSLLLLICSCFVIFPWKQLRSYRTLGALFGALILYALSRFLFLGNAVASNSLPFSVFYTDISVYLSLLPAVFLLFWITALCLRSQKTEEVLLSNPLSVPKWKLLSISLSSLLLGLGAFLQDPGETKAGRILIDESHGDWEKTEIPLNEDLFGTQATYNYYNLVELLRFRYPQVDRNFSPISNDILSAYDVLILKTPTKPYEEREVSSILEFVRQGGGVWLIGDHTDVFGMNSYLNSITKHFDIELQADSLDDLVEHEQQVYVPFHFPLHPIAQWMPQRTLFMTSCSLDVGWQAALTLIGHTAFSDRADYSRINFMGNVQLETDEPFGIFAQGAVAKLDRGRVAVFTDSTMFSNFALFYPGKRELVMSTVDWLNRSNQFSPISHMLLLAGLIGAVVAAMGSNLLTRKGMSYQSLALPILFGGVLGFQLAGMANKLNYPRPEWTCSPSEIGFITAGANYKLPLTHQVHKGDSQNYHSFFVGTQRLGFFPKALFPHEELEQIEALVLLNLSEPLKEKEIQEIVQFVKEGKSLIVMDSGEGNPEFENSLLSKFQVSIVEVPVRETELSLPYPSDLSPRFIANRRIDGGESVAVNAEGDTVIAHGKLGKGQFLAVALGESFSNAQMGNSESVPDENQAALFQLEFFLFRELLNLQAKPPCGGTQRVEPSPK